MNHPVSLVNLVFLKCLLHTLMRAAFGCKYVVILFECLLQHWGDWVKKQKWLLLGLLWRITTYRGQVRAKKNREVCRPLLLLLAYFVSSQTTQCSLPSLCRSRGQGRSWRWSWRGGWWSRRRPWCTARGWAPRRRWLAVLTLAQGCSTKHLPRKPEGRRHLNFEPIQSFVVLHWNPISYMAKYYLYQFSIPLPTLSDEHSVQKRSGLHQKQ